MEERDWGLGIRDWGGAKAKLKKNFVYNKV